MNNEINPLEQGKRIITLDIIRGFALFGILLVNMQYFNTPKFFMVGSDMRLFDGTANQLANHFISIFATGKFFTIFSFLFGLGFYIFIERIQEKGLPSLRFYRRRLVFLFILGLIHGILIWSGDILLPYSLAGFFLLLFRNSQIATIKKWAIALFGIFTVIIGFLYYLSTIAEKISNSDLAYTQLVEQALIIYQNGSYAEILAFRLGEEVPLVLLNLMIVVPVVLSVFLFGLYVGKKGVLKNIHEHKHWIAGVWKKNLIYFVTLTIASLLLKTDAVIVPVYAHDAVIEMLNYITGLIGSFFYITSLTLICLKDQWLFRLKFLAPVGQLALTNYLMQTIICIFLFYSFGLGLFGNVTPVLGIVLTITIFFIQIIFSNYWLRKFKYGPVEWLWRAFTYNKRPKMIRNKVKSN